MRCIGGHIWRAGHAAGKKSPIKPKCFVNKPVEPKTLLLEQRKVQLKLGEDGIRSTM